MAVTLAQGIFSSRTGDFKHRGDVQKSYWAVQELESGDVEVQALNNHNIPTGPKLLIPRERFLSNYHPEPEFYANTVLPNLMRQNERIKRGEGHRNREESYSAEYEFSSAVAVDEENVRANFGLGLTFLERGEVERAEDVFKRLVRLKAIYTAEHKHLFNEFGISMRKNRMFDHALKYYHRAEELCDDDENLCLNISRAYFEKGDIRGCIVYLEKSLSLNPSFDEAGLFKDFLLINGFMNDNGEVAIATEEFEQSLEKEPERLNKTVEFGKVIIDDVPEFDDSELEPEQSSEQEQRSGMKSKLIQLDF
ncbi:tetratricopeptide repeat protein [Maridesulfovibrio sp.]|uniref:tetratricopeptide repeat protein n=1 Tax=Maridesulfovibrio sp. TaxID=2795000 RepID=UPI0039EEAD84